MRKPTMSRINLYLPSSGALVARHFMVNGILGDQLSGTNKLVLSVQKLVELLSKHGNLSFFAERLIKRHERSIVVVV